MLVFNIVILQISVSHDEIQKNGETVKNSGWMCHSAGSYKYALSLSLIPYFIVILPLRPFVADSSILLKNMPISITLFVVSQPLFIGLHHQYAYRYIMPFFFIHGVWFFWVLHKMVNLV